MRCVWRNEYVDVETRARRRPKANVKLAVLVLLWRASEGARVERYCLSTLLRMPCTPAETPEKGR